ncbi:MAG TPA: PQQ-binding-like beta-propeller repeat protein [Bacteroidota bacterium]|nr:PQQ-binding-like beta-propeller repeat protein [Bacteroidota bacterium]
MKRTLLLLFLLLSSFSCTKKRTIVEPGPSNNWVTKQQVNIPWPGLASSAWPMRLHDPQHTGRSSYAGPQSGAMEWRVDAGSAVYCSPAIDVDGSVYFSTFSGSLTAVSQTGSVEWQAAEGSSSGSLVISSDGSIYGWAGLFLVSHDRSGNLNWEYPFAPNGITPFTPTISRDGGTVFFASDSLYAIRKDGSLRWKVKPDSTDPLGTSPTMSPDGATIYATGLKALYALDTSGTLRWRFVIGGSDPAVDNDGNIYIGDSQHALYSLTPSGAVRWVARGINWGYLYELNPIIGWDGSIYIAGNQGVFAFDYAGNPKWNYQLPSVANLESVPAIDRDGTLYFGWSTGLTAADSVNFMALYPNGTPKFRLSLRNLDGTVPDIDSDPAISADGKVYVGCDQPSGRYLFKVR